VQNVLSDCTSELTSEFLKWVLESFGNETNWTVFVFFMATLFNWLLAGLYAVAKRCFPNIPACRFNVDGPVQRHECINIGFIENDTPYGTPVSSPV